MAFDPKHTAVVLIEYQNDFTSEGGALHGAVGDVMESTGMLDNTRRLVDGRARRRSDDRARADHLRAGLRRAGSSTRTGSSRAWSTPPRS